MKLRAKEVMAAVGPDGLTSLLELSGMGFKASLELAQLARKLEDEAKTIQGRIVALRKKHGADEKLDMVLQAHKVAKGTPEDQWPPECASAANEALDSYLVEVNELVDTEMEVLVEPVAIPQDVEGVTPAMLLRLVKFVKAA